MKFFDPDRDWRTPDKAEHFAGCALVCFGLSVAFPYAHAIVSAVLVGAAHETGQVDALRDVAPARLGTPGYGFSWLDMAFNAAGALLGAALHAVLVSAL